MSRVLRTALLLALTLTAPPLAAQSVSGVPGDLLREIMPDADRFEPKAGDPPVIRAYDGDHLVGFVFLTEDIPPESHGYSGPVQAVVGMELDGTVTGARVTDYYESYRSSMGDFLRDPGVQEQFAGKSIADAFQVNGDVKRVTGATISTQALARGIRDASRRVAEAYAAEMTGFTQPGPVALTEMSWFEMRSRGVVKRILIESSEGYLDISMAWLPNDSIAEFFLGEENVPRIHAAAERWDIEDPTFIMYALEGPRLRFFLRENWLAAQGGDTLDLAYEQVYWLSSDDAGLVGPESSMAGVFMLDDRVDVSRPFSLLYELEGHEGYYVASFDPLVTPETVTEGAAAPADTASTEPAPTDPTEPVPEATPGDSAEEAADAPGEGAEAPSGDPTEPVAAAAEGEPGGGTPPPDPADSTASTDSDAPSDATVTAEVPSDSVGPAEAPTASADPAIPPLIDFTRVQEESELAMTFAGTDWGRVGRLVAVLALALLAFFLKSRAVRWISLAATVVVLGFVDATFLSISHVTAAIWAGPGVFLRDLPLLIMVGVTLLTTLVWGRVFCGTMCPFGALQDFLEWIVPRRFRVRVPWSLHLPALKVKYVVLAAILLPAILGSRVSLYQWFEPFGTVFFPSSSAVLWSIAGLFLLGAALVPRFYCRYACPLGAGLALASLVSFRRIGRVEQCDHCLVCEQDCPTGAIQGPDIDFAECVRCNRCEINLLREVGTCRHNMEELRPRLVQIQVPSRSRAGV